MHTSNFIARSSALVIAAAILTGCGSKPPGCADAETVATAKGIFVDHANKFLQTLNTVPDDPDGWTAKYLDTLKVEVSGIVNEGYKAEAKKQFCKGSMKVTTISGETFEENLEYSTQRTEDDKTGFIMEIKGADQMIIKTGALAETYIVANRWTGDWNGTYACNGYKGATEGTQGPYRVPVAMTMKGREGMIERTTLGGGVEAIGVELHPRGKGKTMVHAEGEGRNSPDDRWFTKFEGEVQGRQLTADGAITVSGEGRVRQCRLELTQGAPLPSPSSTAAPRAAGIALSMVGNYKSPNEGVEATISPAGPDGKLPVALSVTVSRPSGGGCGGDAKGFATPTGNTLRFVAEDRGDRCQATLTFNDGQLQIRNTEGCDAFIAGAGACTFEATLAKAQ